MPARSVNVTNLRKNVIVTIVCETAFDPLEAEADLAAYIQLVKIVSHAFMSC